MKNARAGRAYLICKFVTFSLPSPLSLFKFPYKSPGNLRTKTASATPQNNYLVYISSFMDDNVSFNSITGYLHGPYHGFFLEGILGVAGPAART